MATDDQILRLLMQFADDEALSIALPVTVYAGATRAVGQFTSRLAYAEHLDRTLQDAFTKVTGNGHEHAGIIAGGFDGKFTSAAQENNNRRTELNAVLGALAHSGQRLGTKAQEELDKLDRLDVLILKDAKVWGPGYAALDGPLEVEFFRIPVRSIDGWVLGSPS